MTSTTYPRSRSPFPLTSPERAADVPASPDLNSDAEAALASYRQSETRWRHQEAVIFALMLVVLVVSGLMLWLT